MIMYFIAVILAGSGYLIMKKGYPIPGLWINGIGAGISIGTGIGEII